MKLWSIWCWGLNEIVNFLFKWWEPSSQRSIQDLKFETCLLYPGLVLQMIHENTINIRGGSHIMAINEYTFFWVMVLSLKHEYFINLEFLDLLLPSHYWILKLCIFESKLFWAQYLIIWLVECCGWYCLKIQTTFFSLRSNWEV